MCGYLMAHTQFWLSLWRTGRLPVKRDDTENGRIG
jgi:hypothetical protein